MKLLTVLLRHLLGKARVPYSAEGWVKLEDILKLDVVAQHHFSESAIIKAVLADVSARLSVATRDNVMYIRANYGHSPELGITIPYAPLDVMTCPVVFSELAEKRWAKAQASVLHRLVIN